MILIIGGSSSGKRDYARSLGYDGEQISKNVWELVRDNPAGADALLESLCGMSVVICDEVGSGIVPVAREERDARDACGRLCIALAEKAERVVRMICGIPTILK